MGGTLTLTDGCLRVQAEEYPAEKGYLVIWPAGFTYAETSAGLTVYNADRERVAAVGEAVTLGGGEVSRSYEVEFEENARQVLTEACSGPYWLAGTVE